MRLIFLCFLFIMITLPTFAQRTFTSEVIDVKNRFRTLRMIHADNDGYFLMDNRYKHLNMAYSSQRVPTIYRFDNKSRMKFMKEYEKEFDGYGYGNCLFMKGSIYLFAHKMQGGNHTIYSAKISTTDGSIIAPFTEISKTPISKRDEISYNISYTPDSSHFVIGVNLLSDKKTTLFFSLVDDKLNVAKVSTIDFSDDPDKKQLEDVMIVDNTSFILVEGEYAYTTAKKKRDIERYLKGYTLKKYTFGGGRNFSFQTSSSDTYPLNGKGLITDSRLMFIELFSNKAGVDGKLNGYTASKINLATGKLESTNTVELSVTDLGLKTEDVDKGFGQYFVIKHIVPNPVLGGYVVLAEFATNYESSSSTISKDPFTGVISTTSSQVVDFSTASILTFNLREQGKPDWINLLSKAQWEVLSSRNPSGFSTSAAMNPWSLYYNTDYPLYSSFAMLRTSSGVNLIFNDNDANGNVTGANVSYTAIRKFQDAETYMVMLDYKTGKFKRKVLNIPVDTKAILMPKTAITYGNNIYIASYLKKNLGKGEVVASRIEVAQ